MRLVLNRPTLVMHGAGEIVEVSPDRANYLLSVGSAALVEEEREKEPKQEEPKEAKPKTTRKKK